MLNSQRDNLNHRFDQMERSLNDLTLEIGKVDQEPTKRCDTAPIGYHTKENNGGWKLANHEITEINIALKSLETQIVMPEFPTKLITNIIRQEELKRTFRLHEPDPSTQIHRQIDETLWSTSKTKKINQ